MIAAALRWVGRNLLALLIAFVLALMVWGSAVINADPNLPGTLGRKVTINYLGKDAQLKIMGAYQTQVELSLEAPNSIWQRLNTEPELIIVSVDLSSLGPGVYTLPVQVQINSPLVRNVRSNPVEVQVSLEEVISQTYPIKLVATGQPPVGYLLEAALLQPEQVTISGPASLISKVREVRAQVDLNGVTETMTKTLALSAVDAFGVIIRDLTLAPQQVRLVQPVSLQGGYRNVIVKVVTNGIVANGYRLSNYFINPSSVVIFSSDPRLVEALPGYVETKPLELTGADDDFEALLELNLPEGVTAVSGPKVLVQVSVAAIESSLNVSVPVEVRGLAAGLQATVAPATVDMIVSGPVPVLRDLTPDAIRVILDLTGFDAGVYQVIPVVDFLPARLQKVSLLPTTVEVTLTVMPTVTPTITPTVTPRPTRRP